MPASKAQQKAVNKYVKANYDLYQIKMPKGKKDDLKAISAAAGESMNQYIINAISQRMERDTGAAEAAGEGLPQFVTRAAETQAQRDRLSRRMEGGKANE